MTKHTIEWETETEGAFIMLEGGESVHSSVASTRQKTFAPFPRPFSTDMINMIIESVILDDDLPYPWTIRDEIPILQIAILRLVCREWNRRIINKPVFWTRFFFKLDVYELDWLQDQIENGELQMTRTGDCGLSLYIADQTPSRLTSSVPVVQSLMAFIQRFSDRWTSMNVSGSDLMWLMDPLLFRQKAPRTQWSNLRKLSLDGYSLSDVFSTTPPASNLPSLQTVILGKTDDPVLKWGLPWSQLTHLSIAGDIEDLGKDLPVLGECVNLESLTLALSSSNEDEEEVLDPFAFVLYARDVYIRSLVSLRFIIDGCKFPILIDVLPRFILPRLESLEIRESWPLLREPPYRTSLHAMRRVIYQSRCNLQRLVICFVDHHVEAAYHEEVLGALLQETQHSLRILDLEGEGFTGTFLKDFQPEQLERFFVTDWVNKPETVLTPRIDWWIMNQAKREVASAGLSSLNVELCYASKEREFIFYHWDIKDGEEWEQEVEQIEEEEEKLEEEEEEELEEELQPFPVFPGTPPLS